MNLGNARVANLDGSPRDDSLAPSASRIPWLDLLVTFGVMLLFSWLGIMLSRHSDGVATIWISNGLLFGIIIRRPRSVWPWFFLVGVAADTLADLIYGDRLALSFGVAISNSIEVIIATVLLTYWFGQPFKLSRLRPLVGFLAIAVVGGPIVCSLLGTFWERLFIPSGPWWEAARTWYFGDSLGMAMVAPLVFVLQRPGFFAILQRRQLPRTLLILIIPSLATLLVFTHDHDPLIFAIFPALLFVVFRLGFPGSVLAIFVIACIAISLTVAGHGPLMLIPGASMLHRIVVVQIFVAVALFTCFPVAALLEEHKALETSLQESEAQYRELANTDALTGVGNRRAFDDRLAAEWHDALTHHHQLALLSIDIDIFKIYNDIYGHLAGDECLRRIATVIAESLRPDDPAKVFRLGGEEFAAILPATTADQALLTAESVRRAVLEACIEHTGSPHGCQTISVGVASLIPTPAISVLTLLTLSDEALYRAKRLGRNRAELADKRLASIS